MEKISKVYFTDGVAGNHKIRLFLSCNLRAGHFNLTRLCFMKTEEDWYYYDFESIVHSICLLTRSITVEEVSFFALGRDGKVLHMASGQKPVIEDIVDAGTGENKYGYVTKIKEIDQQIYACGASGQVYHRTDRGWVHMDQEILEPLPFKLPRLFLCDMDGTTVNNIYAVGDEGYIFHYDGHNWKNVSFETNLNLLSVKCLNQNEIYVGGQKGLLLSGNHHGWKILVDPDEVNIEKLYDIEFFEEKIYLSTEKGLMIYDGKDIQPVNTKLNPPLVDVNFLSTRNGILWSIGEEDLAYYNGEQWRRVTHPDNQL